MRCLPTLTCFALCATLTGCSLSEHLARRTQDIERRYAETRPWDSLPLRTISWEQALAVLRRSNTELFSAQKDIEKAEREEVSVYTDLIPRVSYYGYATQSLSELTNELSSSDTVHNVNVYFHIPTLTQIPYRVYAAQATTYAARKAKEGKERELTAKLYQMLRKREIAAAEQALAERTRAEDDAPVDSPDRLLQRAGAENTHWAETARLLGDYSARWNILPETMPHVHPASYSKRLGTLDPLVVCQFALKLEQARMAQYSVALTYLPTVNTNLFSPSLFSSTGGNYSGTFLDSKDTKLNLGISYTLDTDLRTWQRYRDSKDAYEKAQREVNAALAEHKNKMQLLRRSMENYDTWRSYMKKRMDYLRETPTETAADFLTRRKELADMERELLAQEAKGIESEAAIILEYGMPQ